MTESQTPWHLRWAWIATNLTTLLTVSGLLVYVTMRLTYGFYYGGLGASPEELGLGYAQLVAQSALGVVGVGFAAGLLAIVIANLRGYGLVVSVLVRSPRPKAVGTVTLEEYRESLDARRAGFEKVSPNVANALPSTDDVIALRDLEAMEAPTDAQLTDRERLRSQIPRRSALLLPFSRDIWHNARRIVRTVFLVAAAGGVVALPFFALNGAGAVRSCQSPPAPVRLLLGVRADRATLLGTAVADLRLSDGRMLLVGSTSDWVLLYNCDRKVLFRIHAQDALVVSTQR